MYTYKLGGMLITDELYHDDLDAMTFGRKDQNELMHYGIKGQSWGKRRFQNEDGSLTAAGRNRYDVGDPRQGVSAYSDTGGRGGSGVSYRATGTSRGSGGSSTSQPRARIATRPQQTNGTRPVSQSVMNRANNGKKAADNLFGRIGNFASNAAKNVGNTATNAYNNATQWAGDRAREAGEAVRDTANNVGNTASNLFNDARNAVSNAANDVGDWTRNSANNVGEAVRDAASNLGNTPEVRDAANAVDGARDWVENAARNVGNFVGDNYNRAREAVTGAANDVGEAAKNLGQNISDWYTGDKAGREAQRYDNIVQNFERNGERNINEGVNKISDSIDKNIDRIDIDLHGNKGDSSAYYQKNRDDLHDMSDKQFWEGLNQRNMGYSQHDIAGKYGQKADEAQARYDAAPRQLLNSAGNWIGDRVSDVGNAVGTALKPGVNAVENAVRDAGNWVGDTAKNIYDDVDYRLYSLGQDIAQPAKNRAWQDFQNRIAQDRETYNREFPSGDYQTWKSASNRIDDAFKDYQRESNKIEQNPISSAINNVGRSIGEGVQKVGDWAGNAAKDVGNWGAGAIDKGKTAVSNFFSELVNPHYNLNVNDMKSRYEERLAELPKGDIARIRYYGNSQGDQDALREQAKDSLKRGR